MTKDFTMLSHGPHDGRNEENIVVEMTRLWYMEAANATYAVATEAMFGMGYNLVPWQLDPLDQVRSHNESGRRCAFATAHELFARGCVTNPLDFFHMLLGTLNTGLIEEILCEDPKEALLQVARSGIDDGDFSAFLMLPGRLQGVPEAIKIQSYGFFDLDSFGLGPEEQLPKYVRVKSNAVNGDPIVTAERIGNIKNIRYEDLSKSTMDALAKLVWCTLEIVGNDSDNFIHTLGVRLYGQDTEAIFQALSGEGVRNRLKNRLSIICSIWFDPDWVFSLSYEETPIIFARNCHANSGPSHHIDLAKVLGNCDGSFYPAWSNFHLSAKAVELVGTTLTAELCKFNGRWQQDKIDVRRLMKLDETQHHLEWIADAMGLSNQALSPKVTQLSPMEFIMSHGSTMHLGAYCPLLTVNCPSCGRSFLLRAAIFSQDHQVTDLTAWRFPGLKYENTHEGSTGMVLKNSQIVGRIIWAAETCDCIKLEDVEISLHDIPFPRPNTYECGQSDSTGWLCVGDRF